MDLIVLGAGPSYTNVPGAIGASYLLVDGEHALLLDFGQGAFPSLANAWEPSSLDAVVISHLHPDHFIDLVALRHYLRYEFIPPRRLRVLGPADLANRLDALHRERGWTAATLDLEAISGNGTQTVGPFTLEARLVTHTDESYSYRVTGSSGPSLVYSGDCGRAADLAPLIREGDVLLSEVSFGAAAVPAGAMHLNAAAVGELAAERRASRVLLTHLQMGNERGPTIAAVAEHFSGPVELVTPGLQVSLA